MKRTSRQATSKSGTPIKNKPKRIKYDAQQVARKIQKWRSASSVAGAKAKSPVRASNFIDNLWLKVDKSDPEAVRKVLELHAHGKGGEEDAIYFSASRFWYTYKMLQDEHLSYFLLSLWSVRLEAAHMAGNSVLIGDENCALLQPKINSNVENISGVLQHWNTLNLVNWYETYYHLAFGHISLSDNSELARNTTVAFDSIQNSDDTIFFDRYSQEFSVEVQPPDDTDQNLEQSIESLREQLDAVRPRFLYAEKEEIENTNVGDRVIVVLNVMSDVEYMPPLGWSFQPFTTVPSVCIPLEIFENLGVYDQITLAQRFLTFAGDLRPDSQEVGVDTYDLSETSSKQIQTDPVLQKHPELISPPLNFDHNFVPTTNNYPMEGHICRCMPCSNFLFEFVQEWGMQHNILNQPRINVDISTSPEQFRNYDSSEIIDGAGDRYFNRKHTIMGGTSMQYFCTSYNITEAKTRKRNVDLDRLSQSSPDVQSSSSSSSSTASGGEEHPAKQIVLPAKQIVPPQEPLIIIEEDDVPTIVSHVPATVPQSPNVIILDDEGTQPIVNLASSPFVIKHPPPVTKEIKTKMVKDSSSYFTPPQTSQSTDDFIKHFYFDNIGVGIERINLDLILQRTTWGGAHDVLEAARVGQHHRIPTAQAVALILRVLPIIGTRARGGEVDAVNGVGLIKGRFDEFLVAIPTTSSSTPSITAPLSVPKSSRSGKSRSKSKSRSPSPAPTTTPDTPSYEPFLPPRDQTEGGRAFNRAHRYTVAQRGGVNRRQLPRMSGPTSHIGGWYFPPPRLLLPRLTSPTTVTYQVGFQECPAHPYLGNVAHSEIVAPIIAIPKPLPTNTNICHNADNRGCFISEEGGGR